LDVRTAEEFAAGHIQGAVNIPIDVLRARLKEIPRDREIVTYCQVGQRGYVATRILRQSGFSAGNLSGGYKTYQLFQGTKQNPL
jgi:rhodanese-related sulfurtransferase